MDLSKGWCCGESKYKVGGEDLVEVDGEGKSGEMRRVNVRVSKNLRIRVKGKRKGGGSGVA